jgi:hypothetical protein
VLSHQRGHFALRRKPAQAWFQICSSCLLPGQSFRYTPPCLTYWNNRVRVLLSNPRLIHITILSCCTRSPKSLREIFTWLDLTRLYHPVPAFLFFRIPSGARVYLVKSSSASKVTIFRPWPSRSRRQLSRSPSCLVWVTCGRIPRQFLFP